MLVLTTGAPQTILVLLVQIQDVIISLVNNNHVHSQCITLVHFVLLTTTGALATIHACSLMMVHAIMSFHFLIIVLNHQAIMLTVQTVLQFILGVHQLVDV